MLASKMNGAKPERLSTSNLNDRNNNIPLEEGKQRQKKIEEDQVLNTGKLFTSFFRLAP